MLASTILLSADAWKKLSSLALFLRDQKRLGQIQYIYNLLGCLATSMLLRSIMLHQIRCTFKSKLFLRESSLPAESAPL